MEIIPVPAHEISHALLDRSSWLVAELLNQIGDIFVSILRITRRRYFNPVGAHDSGLIGENPRGAPNNLMPYISQVASGIRSYLNIWGNDWPTTPNGTGMRDYTHGMDFSESHFAALGHLEHQLEIPPLNLSTGHGHSLLEMARAFEQVSGRLAPYKLAPRYQEGLAACWPDTTRAEQLLHWQAKRNVKCMRANAGRWQPGQKGQK